MNGIRGALIAAVLSSGVFAADHTLAAQQAQSLAPGRRVRVTAPAAGLDREVGKLEFITADSVVLLQERTHTSGRRAQLDWVDTIRTAVPRTAMRELEVSVGRRGHTLAGLGIGLAVGAAVGVNVPCAALVCAAPVSVALLGGLLGTIVGGSIGTDIWEPVPLDRLRVSMTPLPGGRLGLGASLAF